MVHKEPLDGMQKKGAVLHDGRDGAKSRIAWERNKKKTVVML